MLAAEQAYHSIRELILKQRLRPGERTSVVALAGRLGLGRTPVREAISQLTLEGLLVVRERSGTYVYETTPEEVVDAFSMRRLLEGHAGDLAVMNASDSDITNVGRLLAELEEESLRKSPERRSLSRFLDLDVQFHQKIVALSGSKSLMRLFGALNLDVQIAAYLQRQDPSMARRRQEEHVTMYQALRERDGDALKEAAHEHARAVEDVVLREMGIYLDEAGGEGLWPVPAAEVTRPSKD